MTSLTINHFYILTFSLPKYLFTFSTTWYESALMTAAHILVCLTQEGKSSEEIAREDFDNNLELVSVWIDYVIGIN
jgi:hypothetical protein